MLFHPSAADTGDEKRTARRINWFHAQEGIGRVHLKGFKWLPHSLSFQEADGIAVPQPLLLEATSKVDITFPFMEGVIGLLQPMPKTESRIFAVVRPFAMEVSVLIRSRRWFDFMVSSFLDSLTKVWIGLGVSIFAVAIALTVLTRATTYPSSACTRSILARNLMYISSMLIDQGSIAPRSPRRYVATSSHGSQRNDYCVSIAQKKNQKQKKQGEAFTQRNTSCAFSPGRGASWPSSSFIPSKRRWYLLWPCPSTSQCWTRGKSWPPAIPNRLWWWKTRSCIEWSR